MNDVVVGVDRSNTAARAAVRAAELAASEGVNLHLVMCLEPLVFNVDPVSMTAVGSSMAVDDDRVIVAEAEQFLTDLVDQLPHDQATVHVGTGRPAKLLCREAERLGARTIVVGNRRVQGAARVLGSVAGEVMRHADCDVLVVNTTGG